MNNNEMKKGRVLIRRFFGFSSLLRRYIILNLCIVLIPLILFLSFFYNELENKFINEIEVTHLSMLNQTIRLFDSDIDALIETASRISIDITLTPYTLKSAGYARIEAIKRLQLYGASLGFVDNLMLYEFGGDQFYSRIGTYTVKDFINNIYEFTGDWGPDDFLVQINSRSPLTISKNECYIKRTESSAQQTFMIISAPWASRSGIPIGSIIALINTDWINSYLSRLKTDVANVSLLVDSSQTVLFQNDAQFDVDSRADQIFNENFEEVKRFKINGDKYSFISQKSRNTGWRFITLIPHINLGARVLPFNSPAVAIISVLFIFSILIGVLLAYRNWMPISRLFLRIKGQKSFHNRQNELTEIDAAIQAILTGQEERDRQINENKKLMRLSLLHILLNNSEDVENASFKKQMEDAGLKLNGPYYCVISVSSSTIVNLERSVFIETEAPFSGVYIVDHIFKNYMAIIINLNIDDKTLIDNEINGLAANIGDTSLICGVGRRCRHLSSISKSLIESIIALETCKRMDMRGILKFEDLITQKTNAPDTEFFQPSMLIQGIRQCNTFIIEKCINQLFNDLNNYYINRNEKMLSFYTSIIIHELMSLATECSMPDADIYSMRLIQHSSLPEFIGVLREACMCLCDHFIKRGEDDKRYVFLSIIEYIDRNYTSADMSLQKLSEKFDLSIQYLSHFFKEQSGQNFIDYITCKRFDLACNLLQTTNKRIQIICEEVGYINVPSFIRKFTDIYGVSPGKFRAQYNNYENKFT